MKIVLPADPLGSGRPVHENRVTLTPLDRRQTLLVVDVLPDEGWIDPATGTLRVEVRLPACALAAALGAMERMA